MLPHVCHLLDRHYEQTRRMTEKYPKADGFKSRKFPANSQTLKEKSKGQTKGRGPILNFKFLMLKGVLPILARIGTKTRFLFASAIAKIRIDPEFSPNRKIYVKKFPMPRWRYAT